MLCKIPGTLLRFTNYQKEVSVDGVTVRDAIQQLVTKYPDLREVLFDGAGVMRQSHRLTLNGQMLRHEQDTREVSPSDKVEIVTIVAGG
jgi:molybdopterin converting factor small subunit